MKPTLLLLSSDPDVLSIANESLSTEYNLLIANTGIQGMQQLERNLIQIQMVILDTSLGDMFAQDWLRLISRCCLPYTILIASDQISEWMIESMKAGAMDIVLKDPQYDSELLLAIKQGFEYTKVSHYLSRVAENNRNQAIKARLDSFLKLLKSRKSQGQALSPNEIALYFPAKELDQELPLDQVIKAIESGNTYTLIKAWKQRPKLLIVEDEKDFRDMLHFEFGREFEVILAGSCEEAALLMTLHSDIDFAILDIGLPGMSGDDFVLILKQQFPNIQILMLTAYSEYRLISKTINLGAGDYIIKPCESSYLRKRVFGLLQTSLVNRVLGAYMKADG